MALAPGAACSRGDLESLEQAEVVADHPAVTVKIGGYCTPSGHQYQTFFAANFSARIKDGELRSDYDRDGIPNLLDSNAKMGLSVELADSNSDGYGDLLVKLAGMDLTNQGRLKLCQDIAQDTDQDGLTDCEEDNLLHTDLKAIDTDGDSVPDLMEVRGGMNPLDPQDTVQDLDGDSVSNADEVRLGTPIDEYNSEKIKSYELRYEATPLAGDKLGCVDFVVENVPVMPVANGNLLRLFVIERTPESLSLQRNFRVLISRLEPSGSVLEYDLSQMEEGI